MYKKTITYEDYNGVKREEDVLFNLTEAEVMEMELGTVGGFTEMMTKLIKSPDTVVLSKMFKDLILKSYGEKSADGKYFRKISDNGVPLHIAFSQTPAYSKIYMELLHNDSAAAEFIKGVSPVAITDDQIAQAAAEMK